MQTHLVLSSLEIFLLLLRSFRHLIVLMKTTSDSLPSHSTNSISYLYAC